MKHKNLMAKALYDNMPESPEELAFRKGDILTVIEQNTGGLEGWWLCSLHGRQGIAPGNRLKLLIGPMFESQSPSPLPQSPVQSPVVAAAGYGPKPLPSSHGLYQVPAAHQGAHLQGIYQVPPAQDVYQVPQRSALAVDGAPAKVVTPTRVGNSYTYSRPTQQPQQDVYDVPPMRQQGVYDVPQGRQVGKSHGQGVYDIPPPSQSDLRHQGVYDVPPTSQGLYSVPPCRNNPVQEEGNYDFPQPHKPKQEGIYDIPPPSTHSKATQFPQSGSDTASHRRVNAGDSNAIYDVPPSQLTAAAGAGAQRDLYDIPRGMQTPPPRRLASGERERANQGIYDVPQAQEATPTAPRGLLGDVTDGVNRLSVSSTGSARSSMSTSSSSAGSPSEPRLALDLDSAVQRLGQLQQAVESSSAALLALASSPHWRTFAFMERHANEARAALECVPATLADFLAFGRGAASNATALSDPSLHSKLRRQLQRLEDSQVILQQTQQALESSGWAVHVLAGSAKHQGKSDDLDRFVMVSRTVPDDTKQLASTVSANAELLFRRSPAAVEGTYYRGMGEESVGIVHPLTHNHTDDNYNEQTKPFPVPQSLNQDKANMNNSEKCVKSWMEDYDYVHLQGKDEFERQQKELLDKENITKQKVQLEQEQLNKLKQLEQEVIKPVENDITRWISHQHSAGSSSTPSDSSSSTSSCSSSMGSGTQVCGRDRQLLGFYAEQCEQHFVTLLNAIDAFFGCVAAGQPPRIFVAHSKFVILSAHKLVFIGDTLSRQAGTPDVANRVMNSSNVLCELLKTVVAATKMAALNYPSTPAVQEMVDRVAELSHEAQKFKTQLHQMAAL
ncbi:enhancer of filamentation 1 [Alosa sapidissima]|uniref:enhancer of filamentation 1 n=1 Tax=Alosa sapidissima TaxID=34773 RepID=UPI001C098045|nr:enhancer of filamentation 1 [Alosa sapidissima]